MPAATSEWKRKLAFSEHYNRDIQVYSPKSLMIKFIFKEVFVNSQRLKCFRYIVYKPTCISWHAQIYLQTYIFFGRAKHRNTGTHSYICTQVCTATRTHIYISAHKKHTHIHSYTHTHMCTITHICMQSCLHAHTHVWTRHRAKYISICT